MSKPALIKIILVPALALLAAAVVRFGTASRRDALMRLPADRAGLERMAVAIPAGRYQTGSREPACRAVREVDIASARMWPTEVPGGWWRVFRGEGEGSDDDDRKPATRVSYDEAEAFCRWMSDRYGVAIRLPAIDEWEVAARAGRAGVTYSWGWEPRAVDGVVREVGDGAPNPWGLFQMSGNVAEWCRDDAADTATAPVAGGSWAERDVKRSRVSHDLRLSRGYRDADVGFRFVIEASPTENR